MSDDSDDRSDDLTGATVVPIVGNENEVIAAAVKGEKVLGVGTLRRLKEGQPISPDADYFVRFDGDGKIASATKLKGGEGKPAQVSTPAYRENFERIFGGKVERGQA